MLTSESIFSLRKFYEPLSDERLERDIMLYKSYIENYTEAIGRWREYIKLLETILDERVT